MGTPQPEIFQQVDETGNRLVWVLNRDMRYSYKGTHQGVKVEIPAAHQKIAKHFTQGGNLMPYIEARAFITDYKEPQDFVMDRNGKPQPIFRTKELYDLELSAEEYDEIVGKTSKQGKKELAAEEKRARKTLSEELGKRPGKVAVTDEEL